VLAGSNPVVVATEPPWMKTILLRGRILCMRVIVAVGACYCQADVYGDLFS